MGPTLQRGFRGEYGVLTLFRFISRPAEPAPISGDRVYLRQMRMEDFEEWVTLRLASEAFLAPWEPLRVGNEFDRQSWRRRVLAIRNEAHIDAAYGFLIFSRDSDRMVGGLTIGQVRRGVAQTGSLGYWMGEPWAGRGLMSDAVKAICRHAFTELHLRRIEAACMPHNVASRRVLERNGFQLEGLARQYLCIAGEWADHVTYARLASDP